MSVDKFGRHSTNRFSNRNRGLQGPPGRGFELTVNGNYDIQNKRLCNVRNPSSDTDAVNLKTLKEGCLYSDGKISYNGKGKVISNIASPLLDHDVVTKKYLEQNSIPRRISGDRLSFENKKLQNIGNPELDSDAVSLGYLKKHVYMKTEVEKEVIELDEAVTTRRLLQVLYLSYLRGFRDSSKTPREYAEWVKLLWMKPAPELLPRLAALDKKQPGQQ